MAVLGLVVGLVPDHNASYNFDPKAFKTYKKTLKRSMCSALSRVFSKVGCSPDFMYRQTLNNFGEIMGKIFSCVSDQLDLKKTIPPPKQKVLVVLLRLV